MTATTTFSADTVVALLLESIEQETKDAANMLWGWLLAYLAEHWLVIGLILFGVFVLVTIKAMFGRWGALGSFLYNFFYFGTLFVIGLIWGPEVFVSNWFGFFTALILYPVCYLLVRLVLDKTNLR